MNRRELNHIRVLICATDLGRLARSPEQLQKKDFLPHQNRLEQLWYNSALDNLYGIDMGPVICHFEFSILPLADHRTMGVKSLAESGKRFIF
jgi:hypothetical protein